MERLLLDFNNRDARDWVRIGPVGLARHATLRKRELRPGTTVEVVDSEGNRCIGAVRLDPRLPSEHQWLVELDWETWVDAEESDRQAMPPPSARGSDA